MAITDRKADVLAYLQELRDAAEDYIGPKKFNTVQFFYRNKPEGYFENVKRHNHTMAKLIKDKNGDRKSPINNKLSGVFLGVTLSGGRLPTASPFGNTRIQFPIEALFNGNSGLYFTDFYCSTSSQHYVTLVLSKPGSVEDIFCQENLIELDLESNPFLRLHCTGAYGQSMFSSINKPGLIIEIFYTEKINIGRMIRDYGSDRVFYSRSDIIGKGTSTWGGIRKNESCIHCNPSLRRPKSVGTTNQRISPGFDGNVHAYGYDNLSRVDSYRPVRIERGRPAVVPRPQEPRQESSWSTWLAVGVGAIAVGLLAISSKSE